MLTICFLCRSIT